MLANALGDIDELDLLLFRCGAPALEPAFIEGTNDIVQRIQLFFTAMRPSRIGVLGVDLCLALIHRNSDLLIPGAHQSSLNPGL